MKTLGRSVQFAIVSSIFLLAAAPAFAEIGDVYRVSGERVNLRSGPSDAATVRSTVEHAEDFVIPAGFDHPSLAEIHRRQPDWPLEMIVPCRLADTVHGGSISSTFCQCMTEYKNDLWLWSNLQPTGEYFHKKWSLL